MTFAAFLAQWEATGRIKADGYDAGTMADLSDAERDRARAMLLERGLAGDTTDLAGLRFLPDAATVAALRDAVVLAPQRSVAWQVARCETLFVLTGAPADLDPLIALLDTVPARRQAAEALARLSLPAGLAATLAARLGRLRYNHVAVPLTIAWLSTQGLDLRAPAAFEAHLPLVRRVTGSWPWRRASVLAAIARKGDATRAASATLEQLIAPLPEDARTLVRRRCRTEGEPPDAAGLFARLLGWMESEAIAEGRGGYPGGRGKPDWTDYVALQRRHLAIYQALVAAHGAPASRLAEAFHAYEARFPPTVRLLGTGWEAVVDDVAGRLIYALPVTSGMVTVERRFPIGAEDLVVLRADPYRRAVLEVVTHRILQGSIMRGAREVTEQELAAIRARVLHASATDLQAYIATVDRDHHFTTSYFAEKTMARYAAEPPA